MTTKDRTHHFTEKKPLEQNVDSMNSKKIVSGYKNPLFTNDEIHHKLMRYSRYEAAKQIEAIQKYVRE
jgi:hypothetical protein